MKVFCGFIALEWGPRVSYKHESLALGTRWDDMSRAGLNCHLIVTKGGQPHLRMEISCCAQQCFLLLPDSFSQHKVLLLDICLQSCPVGSQGVRTLPIKVIKKPNYLCLKWAGRQVWQQKETGRSRGERWQEVWWAGHTGCWQQVHLWAWLFTMNWFLHLKSYILSLKNKN